MSIVSNLELMRVEPRVFTDAADAGVVIIAASDGVISGNTLTSLASDFVAAGITPQDSVVAGGTAMEIISVDSATALTVARRRVGDAAPAIDPDPGTGLALSIVSFQRVLDLTEARLLASIGLEPDHPTHPLELAAVVNQDDLMQLVALRAVVWCLARASALAPTDESIAGLASFYQMAADEAARSTALLIDTTGDGSADAVRRFAGVTSLRT